MKTIGFIGMGNMASAIIKGLVDNGNMGADKLYAYALNQDKLKNNAREIGFTPCSDIDKMVAQSDIVIIAVNPPEVKNITGAIKDNLKDDAITISVASSLKIVSYEKQIGNDKQFARVMPNTLIPSGCGYNAVCFNDAMSEEAKETVKTILSCLGKVVEIDEDLFDAFTTFSCTGPFWIYRFMEAMTDAGVYVGFSREKARDMVVENLLGVGHVMSDTGITPGDMIDKMTSPGGNTIEGIRALYRNGMADPIMESISAVFKRCKERG